MAQPAAGPGLALTQIILYPCPCRAGSNQGPSVKPLTFCPESLRFGVGGIVVGAGFLPTFLLWLSWFRRSGGDGQSTSSACCSLCVYEAHSVLLWPAWSSPTLVQWTEPTYFFMAHVKVLPLRGFTWLSWGAALPPVAMALGQVSCRCFLKHTVS